MTCLSCVKNIETNILKTPGVTKVNVDLQKKEGIIIYDSRRTSKMVILEKIAYLGFDVTEIDESSLTENNCTNGLVKFSNFDNLSEKDSTEKSQINVHAKVYKNFLCIFSSFLLFLLVKKNVPQHHWNDLFILRFQY